MPNDKQLKSVRLKGVLNKRQLGQALNAKEFAVLAGVSYSTAREWFRIPGFPVIRSFVFWEDFVQWRNDQTGLRTSQNDSPPLNSRKKVNTDHNSPAPTRILPPRAAKILLEAGD